MTLNKGETTHIDDAVFGRVDYDHGQVVNHECEFVALTPNLELTSLESKHFKTSFDGDRTTTLGTTTP